MISVVDPYQTMIDVARSMAYGGFAINLTIAVDYIGGCSVEVNSPPDEIMEAVMSLPRDTVIEILMSDYPIIGNFHAAADCRDDIDDSPGTCILRGNDGEIAVSRRDMFVIMGCAADVICLDVSLAVLQWYARSRHVPLNPSAEEVPDAAPDATPLTSNMVAEFISRLPRA